jgi:hypothetical protein
MQMLLRMKTENPTRLLKKRVTTSVAEQKKYELNIIKIGSKFRHTFHVIGRVPVQRYWLYQVNHSCPL